MIRTEFIHKTVDYNYEAFTIFLIKLRHHNIPVSLVIPSTCFNQSHSL